MSEEEFHQEMLNREERLEEALQRAESGRATDEDWNIIRYECGAPKRSVKTVLATFSILGDTHEFDSASK